MENLWREDVTASWANRGTDPGDTRREIITEGQLWRVLLRIEAMPPADRGKILVAFSNRALPPYRAEGQDLADLLVHPERPRA